MCSLRFVKLVKKMKKEKTPEIALLFHTEQHPGKTLPYLTGYQGDFAIGIVPLNKKKKTKLYISSLEELPRLKNCSVFQLKSLEAVTKEITKQNIKKVGLHFGEISKKLFDHLTSLLPKVSFIDISKKIAEQRKIKTKDEIQYIKKAVKITEQLMKEAIQLLSTATYEKEIIIYLKKRMISLGVEESFPPIVATGFHSKHPHYEIKDSSKILKGFCILDMGVKYKGYCADLSRTVYLGIPSRKEKEQYQQVYDQLLTIEKTVKNGQKTIPLDFEMIHALGHGIGLDVHEEPLLQFEPLRKNMVIAIEPAQYFAKGGIRIEDDYVVTAKGLERLSKSSRKLQIIPRP